MAMFHSQRYAMNILSNLIQLSFMSVCLKHFCEFSFVIAATSLAVALISIPILQRFSEVSMLFVFSEQLIYCGKK